MTETVHLRRRCMGTVFEIWLVGRDPEHLQAVGQMALGEVARLEALLSRFDPAAELSRVNREAGRGPTRVDHELFEVLRECRSWWWRTGGYFDVRVFRGGSDALRERPPFGSSVDLVESTRSVEFAEAGVSLDLGGYGKGYALDSAMRIVREYGVRSALMHGGTSSALASGTRADGAPWTLRIRDPFADGRTTSLMELPLHDRGYSHSAVFGERSGPSDVLDPLTGSPLEEQAACFVVMDRAADAEALSTGLLAMGRERAGAALVGLPADLRPSQVGWIEASAARDVGIHWLARETE